MFFLCLSLVVQPLFSAPPDWWTTQNVLDTTKTANDYAAVNQGQLKLIAKKAITEMNAKLPGGAGTELNALLAAWSAPDANRNDYVAVNLGQVKSLAKKFYDRLNAVGISTPYPWTGTNAQDYAAANIGQVKKAFSFVIPASLAPPPPSNLVATAGNAQIVLTWNAVSGATSYKLQRSTTSGSGYADFTGNTVTAPTVTLTNTGLTNGTTYYYVAYAINANGTSAPSTQASATPLAVPVAPTGLTAAAGSAQVVLNWTAVSGATSYKVQRSTTSGSGYIDFTGNTVTAPTVTLTNTGLTNGTTYYYVIYALNSSGTSPVSTQASATPLAAPTGLTASAATSQATLTWTAVSGATSYKVQRSTTSGSGYVDFTGNTVTAPTVTFTDTGLTNGTTYYYIVLALNTGGVSAASSQAIATPLSIPVGVTATPGNAQVSLSWASAAGASSYKIRRSTTSGSGYVDFTGNTTTALTFTNTGLTNGTTYYYVVLAVNATGTSSPSSQVSATPVAPPVAPTGLIGTPGNTQATLSWSATAGATSYKVQRSTTTGTGYVDFTGNTVTAPTVTLTNTGLTNGTTYYYVVFAINAGGTSPKSNEVNVVPTPVPAAPTGLTATAGNAQAILNWTAVSGATSYKVQRSTTSGSGYVDFTNNTVTAPTVTLTNSGLTNGTTYYYVVKAINGSGTSGNSNQASVTPSGSIVPGDSDSDGMADSWEMQYFGNLNQTASGDPDGDGVTNIQEYLQGRNPMKGVATVPTITVDLDLFTGGD
ncbi:MAG: fibronectin type III domain-containing protein [Verrucomicrobiota bacterium]